jgi:hypothetical protein
MTSGARAATGLGSFALRAFAWAVASAALLVGGFYAVGASLVAVAIYRTGASPGAVQLAGLHALFFAVLRQALLPHWILTLLTWLVLACVVPRLETAWRFLGPALAIIAALWFPVVGFLLFRAWRPRGAGDIANTWLLMTAAVVGALLLPRLLRFLAPGALARPLRKGNLTGA